MVWYDIVRYGRWVKRNTWGSKVQRKRKQGNPNPKQYFDIGIQHKHTARRDPGGGVRLPSRAAWRHAAQTGLGAELEVIKLGLKQEERSLNPITHNTGVKRPHYGCKTSFVPSTSALGCKKTCLKSVPPF